MYDPRREERRKRSRVDLPDDVTPDQLDRDVRADLRGLSRDTADLVARHLVMTGRLLDSDPEAALTHARAASALGGRVGAVREAAGLAAYAAGEWQEALSELRTFRRITGDPVHLPVLADCERALGRPERALAVGDDPAVSTLEQTVRVELVLVLAGARRDMGQKEAAVLLLQGPARATTPRHPWAARLWYGYADALLDAGRAAEAEEWFSRVLEVDGGETDADERLLELQGVQMSEDGDDGEVGAEDGAVDGAVDEAPETSLSSAELTALVEDVQPLSARRAAPREHSAVPAPDGAPTAAAGDDATGAGEPAAAEAAAPTAPATPSTPAASAPAGSAAPAAAFTAPPAEEEDEADDVSAGQTRAAGRPVPAVTFVQPQDTSER